MTGTRGSYIVEEDFVRPEEEITRLGEQVTLSWPREREVLARLPVPMDGEVLDIGCGPGFVLERLGQMYPNARLTGVDPSPTFLDSAHERLSRRHGARLTLLQGGFGFSTGLGGPHDLALCRYVLQHLPDPLQSLNELRAAVRPGGYAVVIEVDAELLGVSEPFEPSLAEIYCRAGQAQTTRGGDRTVARRLVRLMRAAGFEEVRMDALVLHSDDYGLSLFDHQLSPKTVRPALEQGAISPADYATLQNAYERFRSNPVAIVMSLVFVCTGRRPMTDLGPALAES